MIRVRALRSWKNKTSIQSLRRLGLASNLTSGSKREVATLITCIQRAETRSSVAVHLSVWHSSLCNSPLSTSCIGTNISRQFSGVSSFSPPKSVPKRSFIPRKAPIVLTEKARTFFRALLDNNPDKVGIMLDYQQASSGQPRMVFSFRFVTKDDLSSGDEGVSLEVLDGGVPKAPRESINDGLPKLYVHHNAFLKVLGATVDVNTENFSPVFYDKEGNVMDPNA